MRMRKELNMKSIQTATMLALATCGAGQQAQKQVNYPAIFGLKAAVQ